MNHPIDIFKVPVWHLKNKELPKGIYEWCLECKEKDSKGVIKSNQGGWQSKISSFDVFPYTKDVLKHLEFLPRFELLGWWININEKGDYNITHTHPSSDISVIWYITDNGNSLALEDPDSYGRAEFISWLNGYDNLEYTFNGKEGDIIIFPAYVPHHVKSYTGNTPRISIAFNLRCVY